MLVGWLVGPPRTFPFRGSYALILGDYSRKAGLVCVRAEKRERERTGEFHAAIRINSELSGWESGTTTAALHHTKALLTDNTNECIKG